MVAADDTAAGERRNGGRMKQLGRLGRVSLAVALPFLGGEILAQEAGPRTAEQRKALFEAHKGDFDYLLGDWEFTATSREYGQFRGHWSAVRLDEGQVLDEYRVTGDAGETYYVTTTVRNYNSALDRWEL